jgi:hypothetical protein
MLMSIFQERFNRSLVVPLATKPLKHFHLTGSNNLLDSHFDAQ